MAVSRAPAKAVTGGWKSGCREMLTVLKTIRTQYSQLPLFFGGVGVPPPPPSGGQSVSFHLLSTAPVCPPTGFNIVDPVPQPQAKSPSRTFAFRGRRGPRTQGALKAKTWVIHWIRRLFMSYTRAKGPGDGGALIRDCKCVGSEAHIQLVPDDRRTGGVRGPQPRQPPVLSSDPLSADVPRRAGP